MAITSQVREPLGFGEALIDDGQAAGLVKTSAKMADVSLPELTREQLGTAVRGKYHTAFTESCNVAALFNQEIARVFPTSESVNKALTSLLSIASEARKLTTKPARVPRKRASAQPPNTTGDTPWQSPSAATPST